MIWIAAVLEAFIFFALIFAGKKLFTSFFGVSSKSHYNEMDRDSNTTYSLRALPEPCEAHDILEAFCIVAHSIDVKMSPYCQYEGNARLMGGVDSNGIGWVLFWYDKDHSGVESVLHEIGYYPPGENNNPLATSGNDTGWSINNGMIQYRSRAITGYLEWAGYNTLYKEFGRDATEYSMQMQIEAVLRNEWPEARIISYIGHLDTPSGDPFVYSIQVKTVINCG